jgi:hypothetical protein
VCPRDESLWNRSEWNGNNTALEAQVSETERSKGWIKERIGEKKRNKCPNVSHVIS